MSEIFFCDLCKVGFNSLKSLTSHKNKSKMHKNNGVTVSCEYCKREFSCTKSLKRHSTVCKVRLIKVEIENKDEEKINSVKKDIEELKIQIKDEHVLNVKKEVEYLKQKLEEEKQEKNKLTELSLKTIQTVATNAKTITNNFNVYNYIQPITQECLIDILKQRRKDMITSDYELVDLFAEKLKDKVFQTDSARHVIMYKDGEEMRRDPNAKELSRKIFLVSAPELQNFKPLVEDSVKSIPEEASLDYILEENKKLYFLNSLSDPKDNYLNEFGRNLVQKLPTKEQFFRNQSNWTFFNLKLLLEKKLFNENNSSIVVCQYFLSGVFHFALNISRILKDNDFICINDLNFMSSCDKVKIRIKSDDDNFVDDNEAKILMEISREILLDNDNKVLDILTTEERSKTVNMLAGYEILCNYFELRKFKNGEMSEKFIAGISYYE